MVEATPPITYLGSVLRAEAFPNAGQGEVALHVTLAILAILESTL